MKIGDFGVGASIMRCRTPIASIFPNEASVLRLVTALLVEISGPWETGKIYLNIKSQNQPQT